VFLITNIIKMFIIRRNINYIKYNLRNTRILLNCKHKTVLDKKIEKTKLMYELNELLKSIEKLSEPIVLMDKQLSELEKKVLTIDDLEKVILRGY